MREKITPAKYVSFFILVLLAVQLASCLNSSTKTIELSYWSYIAGSQKIVDLFNQTHQGIHVTYSLPVIARDLQSTMLNDVKTNSTPDLGSVEFQFLPDFESSGGLVDLTPYNVASIRNQFVPWTWNEVMLGSSVYAIPGDTGPLVLYYRSDIFKKYNLAPPSTWNEYEHDATMLHNADPTISIANFDPKGAAEFTGLAWQNGAHPFAINGKSWLVSINNEKSKQVANYWQHLQNEKLLRNEALYSDKFYSNFESGKVVTWVGATWVAAKLSTFSPRGYGKWAAAPIPQWNIAHPKNGNEGGSTEVVFKSTQHPQQAAEFAKWLYTDPQAVGLYVSIAGAYPANRLLLDTPLLNKPNPYYSGQNLNTLFKQASEQVDDTFSWGPTITQFYKDMGDNFSNSLNDNNRNNTLSYALDRTQMNTVNYMKKQGYIVDM